MNTKLKITLVVGVALLGLAYRDYRKFLAEEQTKRTFTLNNMGLEVEAIHRATGVVNAMIDRGQITNHEQLRQAVLTEVAFQKIAMHEDPA